MCDSKSVPKMSQVWGTASGWGSWTGAERAGVAWAGPGAGGRGRGPGAGGEQEKSWGLGHFLIFSDYHPKGFEVASNKLWHIL